MQHKESVRFLSIQDLSERWGMSAVTIWRLEKKGELPKKVKLSPKKVGWFEDTIENYEEAKKQEALAS